MILAAQLYTSEKIIGNLELGTSEKNGPSIISFSAYSLTGTNLRLV